MLHLTQHLLSYLQLCGCLLCLLHFCNSLFSHWDTAVLVIAEFYDHIFFSHDHECGCGHDHHDHHHHHADEVFTSWGRETIKKYTKENLEKMLEALSASDEYGIILRAKGMLPAEDGTWIYFDMVPEETEIREGAPEYTGRLCVIGSKLNEDKLAELFGL